MPALHDLIRPRPGVALLATVLLVGLAGCSGIATPSVGTAESTTTTTPEPPLSESEAENRAMALEREHVREVQVPDDADSWGWRGLATSKAIAVASADDGWFVRVRVGFYYNENTSEGELYADGISRAAYFVTANDATRVSLPGHEMKGSPIGDGPRTLEARVVNTADSARDVSLSVQQADVDTVYEGDTSVESQGAAHTPRLSVADGEYEVVALVDDQTRRLGVTVGSRSESPTEVTVFAAPDGSLVLVRTPSHL